MKADAHVILDPKPSGWRIIEILFDYLTVVDIAWFDSTHKLASLLRGLRREFVVRSTWQQNRQIIFRCSQLQKLYVILPEPFTYNPG